MLAWLAMKAQTRSIRVMDSSGDQPLEFREDDPVSLAEAEKVFNDIKRQGGAIFRAQPDGEGGGQLKEFDPKADMIATPRIAGG